MPINSKLTEEQVALLLESYKAGTPVYELCDKFGIVASTLRYHLKKAGIPNRGAASEIDPSIRDASPARSPGFHIELPTHHFATGEPMPEFTSRIEREHNARLRDAEFLEWLGNKEVRAVDLYTAMPDASLKEIMAAANEQNWALRRAWEASRQE